MRTRDLDEASEAVAQVYCPHKASVIGRAREVNVRLDVKHTTFQPLVELEYNAPLLIDAGHFPKLFLMMHCAQGAARATQDGRAGEWTRGQTMPFSAEHRTKLWFDADFVQHGLRLDLDKMEAHCRSWLGRPLDTSLQFDLRPFSDELEAAWRRSIGYLQSHEGGFLAFSPLAKAAFDEFLLTLLLHHHPHNFSELLAQPVQTPVPGLVRSAERFMSDRAGGAISVPQVADHLGVSVRTLQAGFRQWRNTTPSQFLKEARMRMARDALLRPQENTTVTSVALSFGFTHLSRFSERYAKQFGEKPSATLRRGMRERRRDQSA
jgi:AraC-like DNA-binding protein